MNKHSPISEDAPKIESGIPMPGGSGKYPWDEMRVGDSFFVPGKSVSAMGAVAGGRSARHGGKYACRTVDGGVRVWRVE